MAVAEKLALALAAEAALALALPPKCPRPALALQKAETVAVTVGWLAVGAKNSPAHGREFGGRNGGNMAPAA